MFLVFLVKAGLRIDLINVILMVALHFYRRVAIFTLSTKAYVTIVSGCVFRIFIFELVTWQRTRVEGST
jgi:hypothetical protein